jgi:hypothetical protein
MIIIFFFIRIYYLKLRFLDWGLGIGIWGLVFGDWVWGLGWGLGIFLLPIIIFF